MRLTNREQLNGGKLNGWVVESHCQISERPWKMEGAFSIKKEALEFKKDLISRDMRNSFNRSFRYRIRKIKTLTMVEYTNLCQMFVDMQE